MRILRLILLPFMVLLSMMDDDERLQNLMMLIVCGYLYVRFCMSLYNNWYILTEDHFGFIIIVFYVGFDMLVELVRTFILAIPAYILFDILGFIFRPLVRWYKGWYRYAKAVKDLLKEENVIYMDGEDPSAKKLRKAQENYIEKMKKEDALTARLVTHW